jgi:Haspin like kinase domain
MLKNRSVQEPSENEKRHKNCEIFVCGEDDVDNEEEKKMLFELKNIFERYETTRTLPIGVKSCNAYAMIVKGYHEKRIVVKKPRKTDGTVDSIKYEYVVGCHIRKTLCQKLKNFMKIYGYIHQRNTEYLIIERIHPGTTLRELTCTHKKYVSIKDIRLWSLIMQVLCALQVAQNMVKFTHYDLHFGNVLIKKNDNNDVLTYIYKDRNKRKHVVQVPTFGELAIIIDYGRSRTNKSSKFLYKNDKYFKPYKFLMKRKYNNCDIRTFDPSVDARRFCSILSKYIPDFVFERMKINEPHDAIMHLLKIHKSK